MSVPFAVAYAVLVVALVVLRVVLRARSNSKFKGAASWPLTESTVEFVDVLAEGGRRNRHYVGELAYSYCVEGHYYSGFYRRRFQTEKDARAFVESFRGKNVPVQFKPEDPEISLMSAPIESAP